MSGISPLTLNTLPDVPAYKVAEYLDPPDLAALMRSSRCWHPIASSNLVWGPIAEAIGCPLESKLSARDQVKAFALRLLKILKKKQWQDETLKVAIKPLTKERIIQIRQVITAHDIINIWEHLDHNFDDLDAEQLIAKASQFELWFRENQNQLRARTILYLGEAQLSHLPPQVFELKGLKNLYLAGNQLECAPEELCALTGLEELDLTNNPLEQFPQHLFRLPNLTRLHLTCKELQPDSSAPLALPPNLKLDQLFFEGLPTEIARQISVAIGSPQVPMLKLLEHERVWLFRIPKFVPDDIKILLRAHALTLNEAMHLIQWRRARDTVLIWKKLIETLTWHETSLHGAFGVDKNYFSASHAFITKAAEFPKWVETHKAVLERLTTLHASYYEPPIALCAPSLIGKLTCKTELNWQEATCSKIQSYIGSPTPNIGLFRNALTSSRISRIKIPRDIAAQLRTNLFLSCEQTRRLHDLVKESNTLDIWFRLCKQLNVEKIGQFSAWCEARSDRLAELESLDLSNLDLFFLPPELALLTGLKKLNLSQNHLLAIPDHIWDLPQLEELDLTRLTSFEDITRDLPKLARLKKLKVQGLRLSDKIRDHLIKEHNFRLSSKDDSFEKIESKEKK